LNLILFSPDEIHRPLPRNDPRAAHLLGVLQRPAGGTFDAGLINGPRGRGKIEAIDDDDLTLSFIWNAHPAPASRITLILGLPRPQTARDILRDATTLGVEAMHFVITEKCERSYAQSHLWSEDEWRQHVQAGAEQAFDTRLPDVAHGALLAVTLAGLPAGGIRLALDNYEASVSFSQCPLAGDTPVFLALGPERGWGPADRALLRVHGFQLAHLGPRVLRAETAVVAALTLIRAARGLL